MKRVGLSCGWMVLMVFLLSGKIERDVFAADEPRLASSAPSNVLRQRAYVWQRVWSEPLRREIREHAHDFAALDVLAAEIDFRTSAPAVSSTAASWSLLKETGVTVGVVVRIGPRTRSWKDCPQDVEQVTGVCRRALAAVRNAGLSPAELQIDYDAASSQLGDYRVLLAALRQNASDVPLTITILPSWLESAEFPALAASVDSYVLQLHSLTKPTVIGATIEIFDAERSRRWMRRAAEVGRPFRLALPTYGYFVGFGPDGRFLGLQAEGAARAWPSGTMLKSVWAEPDRIAPFVAIVMQDQPSMCAALCWFRFPCETDELSWRWTTLAAVMQGKIPHARLVFRPVENEPGMVELCVTNEGADRAKFHALQVSWADANVIAADGIDGWRVERRGGNEIVLQRAVETELKPGESMQVGWFRLSRHPTEITAIAL